ncbi:MAG: TRAP transporter small permease [Paracoccaceae bacterium]
MDYREMYPGALKFISGLIDLFLVLGGLAIVGIVFVNATLRGFAGFDFAWSLEVVAFLLLWVTFLGSAAAMARGAHMRVTEIAANVVPASLRRPLAILIDFLVLALLGSLIYHGFSISFLTWAQTTTVLYLPVGLLYAAMPVGMALTLLFHVYNMFIDLSGGVGAPPFDETLEARG